MSIHLGDAVTNRAHLWFMCVPLGNVKPYVRSHTR
uniref:Uncharacterized protein n=1 Tax=Arundo donax TaxID=35708 RepID=A0A0A9C770_ARUDO